MRDDDPYYVFRKRDGVSLLVGKAENGKDYWIHPRSVWFDPDDLWMNYVPYETVEDTCK